MKLREDHFVEFRMIGQGWQRCRVAPLPSGMVEIKPSYELRLDASELRAAIAAAFGLTPAAADARLVAGIREDRHRCHRSVDVGRKLLWGAETGFPVARVDPERPTLLGHPTLRLSAWLLEPGYRMRVDHLVDAMRAVGR